MLLLTVQANAIAGLGSYYYGDEIDEYDRDTGLYFKSVERSIEQGGFISKENNRYVVDLNIYNPETGKSALVFNDGKFRRIEKIIYESAFDNKNKTMVFGGTEVERSIKNNNDLTQRKPKDSIIIYILDKKAKSGELWTVGKYGQNLKKLKSFNMDYDWHIDVKNSKIRIVWQKGELLNIESLEW